MVLGERLLSTRAWTFVFITGMMFVGVLLLFSYNWYRVVGLVVLVMILVVLSLRRDEELRLRGNEILLQKQKLEAILRDMGDAVIVVDSNLMLERINKAAEKLIGLPAKEILGLKCCTKMKLVAEKTKKEIDCLAEAALKGNVVADPQEPLILTVGKRKTVVTGVGTPIRDVLGKVTGAVIVLRDETKQRELSDLKSDFVSLVSHQLRAPLTGIKWYVGLLKDRSTNINGKKGRGYINMIGESNQRLINLVDDLLTTGKLEEIGKKNDVTVESFKSIIQEVFLLQKKLFTEKNIKLVGVEKIDEGLRLEVDRSQMVQVFDNLLGNAGRYSSPGSKVEILVEEDKDVVRLMVKDRGVGIPDNQKTKVFQRFFRADNVVANTQGTGLGLYLTKGIIERHGGKIWFESKVGKGTTFFVELPIKQKNE